jgi:hypothetical protein
MLRVGGIKVSPALAQLDLARGPDPEKGLFELLDRLAATQINLPFFTWLGPGSSVVASMCVAEGDRTRAGELAQAVDGVTPRLSVLSPVVAVSVFPHQRKAALLAAVLRVLTERELPLLGLATSLSALTFTLGAHHLARALGGLDAILELPENHAPLRWELLVKQTPP